MRSIALAGRLGFVRVLFFDVRVLFFDVPLRFVSGRWACDRKHFARQSDTVALRSPWGPDERFLMRHLDRSVVLVYARGSDDNHYSIFSS